LQARVELDRLVAAATEVFATAPPRARIAGAEAWISLPADAPVNKIDELATRVGGQGLIIFERDERTVATYLAPGRDDEFDVTDSAVELRQARALDEADVAWCLATESWEIALARYLVSSGMVELRVWQLPVAVVASELRRHDVPATDREWEQLGARLREQLSSTQDVEVPSSIDHTFFAHAARTTRAAR
jgi:hypothetical protein